MLILNAMKEIRDLGMNFIDKHFQRRSLAVLLSRITSPEREGGGCKLCFVPK